MAHNLPLFLFYDSWRVFGGGGGGGGGEERGKRER